MKTVKIPECMNPFEVIVNNQRYRYPGGTEQEVPDEVAEVIEVHMKNHADMTAPPYVPGGGGGYSTCKVHVSFTYGETDNGVTITYATMRNGKPCAAGMRYGYVYDEYGEQTFPSQREFDFEVICGSHIIIGDDYFTGIGVQGDLSADSVGGCKCVFVPGDKANYSISISQ